MPRFPRVLGLALVLLPAVAGAAPGDDLAASIRAATTGAPAFTITPPRATAPVKNACTDFGLSTTATGAANYAALRSALAYCRRRDIHRLVVEPGTYKLGDGANPPTALIDLEGFTDFTFDGGGALFLCEAKAIFVLMQNCQRVVMTNYQLDWDWTIAPVQSLGQVQRVASDGSYVDLRYPYEDNPAPSPIPHELVEVDGTTYDFIHRGLGVVGQAKIRSITPVASHVLRYTAGPGYFTTNHAAVGQWYVARHFEYEHPGTKVAACSNLTFVNVTTYSTLGMGYVCHDCDHIQFVDAKIIRRPDTAWPWRFSSAADGIHCENNHGYIKLLNVEIGHAGDDAVNIHDTLAQGIAYVAGHPKQLRVASASSWQYPFAKGDTVQLRCDDFSPAGFESTLSTVPTYRDGNWTLTFTDAVPPGLAADTIVFNQRYRSDNYVVRNCRFHHNKVRGLVVYTANGTIEGNTFFENYSPGLFIITASTKYKEGKGPTNIIVRNNVFDGNDIKRNTFPTMPNMLVIAAETPQYQPVPYGLCRNIIVEGNLIKNSPYAAIEVASASHVLVADNTIVNPNLYAASSVTGSLMVLDARDVVVTHNRVVVERGMHSHHTNTAVDAATTTRIFADPPPRR